MLSFFPRGVLDEILNLIESVSEIFSSYSLVKIQFFRTAENHEELNENQNDHFVYETECLTRNRLKGSL